MRGNTDPTILLLGKPRMLRDVIAYYVRNTAPDLHVIDSDSFLFDSLHEGQKSSISLIAFIDTTHDTPALLDEIRRVHEAIPDSAIAIISDCHDHDVVAAALQAGIRGYITMSTSGAVLSHAFRILLNGGEFVPAATLLPGAVAARKPPAPVLSPTIDISHESLSRRERDVLTLLRQGKQNKVIAAELEMQESTVKVHMRNLMRKFHASNRLGVILAANQLSRSEFTDGAAGDEPEIRKIEGNLEGKRSSTH